MAPSKLMQAVLESAARLQQLVPDAVLVGGTAAALYAEHRESFDHDHVVGDLAARFDIVLEALESEGDWVTNRVAPGKIILGQLGDIEAGVRQMIRLRPLEVSDVELPSGALVRVPTEDETLRIKGFLVVRRNQVRDFLDVAALSDHLGTAYAARVLSQIDTFYADQQSSPDGIRSQLLRQLGDPRPADQDTLRHLNRYKGLREPWTAWPAVRDQCQSVAQIMLTTDVP